MPLTADRIDPAESVSQSWAYRLVATWCDNRAQNAEAQLLRRCRRAYRKGPMVAPVNRFADLLEQQTKANAAEWRALAAALREEASSQ